MLSKMKMKESIREIYSLYLQRNETQAFTLESISNIFEIGNEVFQKNNPEEVEKFKERPESQAPDIMDDEPFSLERTLEIFKTLETENPEITPALIQKVFEINSRLAWKSYRSKYDEYMLTICEEYPNDEYINYLSAIVNYDRHLFDETLHCINIAISKNPSSANYTHIKSLCLIQRGEFETARTYLYQSLFLVELRQNVPPRKQDNPEIYPNYPIEFHTSASLIRGDLQKIDTMEKIFKEQLIPMLD